jgi:hypothetical protein
VAHERSSREAHTKRLEEELAALKADITSYEVEEVQEVGRYLVMKVKYLHPDGRARPGCTFEGSKVMVFEATVMDALKWKAIDPHFAEKGKVALHRHAPAPIARFPAGGSGFEHALKFATMLLKHDEGGGGE